MQLEHIERQGRYHRSLTQQFFTVFTREPQDKMAARQYTPFVSAAYGIGSSSKIMPPIDTEQRIIVGTLDTILHHQEGAVAQLL